MTNTDKKIEELKEATREANQMLKDLKAERKECKEFIDETLKKIETILQKATEEGLAKYSDSILEQIGIAQAKVDARFDKIAAILLGEDKSGKPTITELAVEVRKKREY